MPDSVTDSNENNLNKKQSDLYKKVHDELGIDYVTAAKDLHKQNIPDWRRQDIEKLSKVFIETSYKQQAQTLFDNCYDDITRAYVSVKHHL